MNHDSRQTTLGATGDIDDLEDINWSFEGVDTQEYTHGLHNYPARMVPQIVDSLLSYYESENIISEGDTVYDPFSGSGTTAVEARLHNLNAVGNDINPFAVMLSEAKSIPLDRSGLVESSSHLRDGLESDLRKIESRYDNGESLEDISLPDVNDGWFPQPQLYQLSRIRDKIDEIEQKFGYEYARFYRIVLSHTTRKVSYQRNGEFKRYRKSEEDREEHNPEVYPIFENKLVKNIDMMKEYSDIVNESRSTNIQQLDSRTASSTIGEDSADIVITSPPYGDHKTTVAYGQFSRDPAVLTGEISDSAMLEVDKNGLGGRNTVDDRMADIRERSPSLDATIEALEEKEGRDDDALDFFSDYFAVMEDVGKILKSGQPVAWVVANRTMSRVNIPTHLITRELCESLGFNHDITLPREIPNKTLPWENAPENVTDLKGEMMANENIVIMNSP
jgi:DNA modification methylase